MKGRHLLVIVPLIAMTAILVWLLLPREAATPSNGIDHPTEDQNEGTRRNISGLPDQAAKPRDKQTQSQSAIPSNPDVPADVLEFVRRTREDPSYEWKQPINFYGRVVDENGLPIQGATAHFSWTDLSPNGTSEERVQCDVSGFFSLVNRTGKRLSVRVGKDGFYTPKSEFFSFEYANPADGLFAPAPNRPVIFHLRKRGPGTDLLTSQYGVKDYLGVSAPLDGTPVQVNPLERKVGEGPLTISQSKPTYESWKQAAEWSFRMEIPEGGFIEQSDEFPFEAPETGYEPVAHFHFQKESTNWMTNLRKDYYIKFGNPPRYGRLHLETSISMSGARLTYAINPNGTRYLEPK